MDFTARYDSPLGPILLGSDGEALIGLWFEGQKYFASVLAPEHEEKELSVFRETADWLDVYFSGREPDFTPPLRLRGTPYQKRIWELLLAIPYGKTTDYRSLSLRSAQSPLTQKGSPRAVGAAVGRNPVSIIVPCHRVLSSDFQLRGYAGGLEKKRALLSLEGITVP